MIFLQVLNKFNKLFIFLIFIFSCSNPIEKKKKDFENCDLYFVGAEITKYNLVLIPPTPKIYFKVYLELENKNESEVVIEKFHFDLYSNFKKVNDVLIAKVDHLEEIIVPPLSNKQIEIELVTFLEDNPDKDLYKMILIIIKSIFKNQELDFKLDGILYYNSIIGKIEIPFKKILRIRMNPKL